MSFVSCSFDVPFDEFNPSTSGNIDRLEYDEKNTNNWEKNVGGAKLSFDDLVGIDESLYGSRRQRNFYSRCKFNSNTTKVSSLYSSKGRINYLTDNQLQLAYTKTILVAEGYCEYRLKRDEDAKYFSNSKKLKKGGVVFIDEVFVERAGIVEVIIVSPSIKVLKRHFK